LKFCLKLSSGIPFQILEKAYLSKTAVSAAHITNSDSLSEGTTENNEVISQKKDKWANQR